MKDTPKVITPTASTIGTPNWFAASAETPESELDSVVESTVDIPDNEYLPNQEAATEVSPEATTTITGATDIGFRGQPSTTSPNDHYPSQEDTPGQEDTNKEDSDDDLSLSSISTMGSTDSSTDNTATYSKAKIISIMERIQLNCTKTTSPYKYTDVASFQMILSNALVRLPSDKSKFGYSFLVDSNADHKERTNSTDPPDAMPSLPKEPDYTSKLVYKKYLSDKKHYYACK